MINVSGKYFRKFAPRELFTEYIYSLMKQGKAFMVFPDNNQILVDDEVDEWNYINGLLNPTERVIYHQYGNDGYVVHCTGEITTVTIPMDMLKMSYEDFIKQCEEDVLLRME